MSITNPFSFSKSLVYILSISVFVLNFFDNCRQINNHNWQKIKFFKQFIYFGVNVFSVSLTQFHLTSKRQSEKMVNIFVGFYFSVSDFVALVFNFLGSFTHTHTHRKMSFQTKRNDVLKVFKVFLKSD